MFSVIVIIVTVILFLIERRLNARAGTKRRSNVPSKRVAAPRRK